MADEKGRNEKAADQLRDHRERRDAAVQAAHERDTEKKD